MTQQIFVRQGDRGHDQRNTSPRKIIANAIITPRLELFAVILVRNAQGQSVFNPVEHVMGVASIGLSVLAAPRELAAVPEV